MQLNPMSLNNNSMLNNTMSQSMQINPPFFNNNSIMPQPFYYNNFFNVSPLPFPNSYPIMNNTLNLNRFNFFGLNDFNSNSNNYLNNSFGSISLNSLNLSLNNSLDSENNDEFKKLKKQFIKELDVYQYKNKDKFDSSLIEEECSICLSKYKITDMLKILPCKHGFHKKCIKKWLSDDQHNKCPLCNLDIKAEVNKRKADLEKHIYDAEHEDE